MPPELDIAVTPDVALPEALRGLRPTEVTDPMRVEADILVTGPESFYLWFRHNRHLPVLALDQDRLVSLGVLGARLVPPPNANIEDLRDLLEALVHVLTLLSPARQPPRWRLSPREREVLQHLASGLTLVRAADRMGISENTAKNHLTHARLKLGERERTAAVLKAAEYGLIDWPPLEPNS